MTTPLEARAIQGAGHFDFDPQISHHFADHLYAKQMVLPAGSEIISHKHRYSHLSLLAQGRVIVSSDDSPRRVYVAPACIEIKAGVHHAIEALDESVWFCIHATDEKDPDQVDPVLIQPTDAGV